MLCVVGGLLSLSRGGATVLFSSVVVIDSFGWCNRGLRSLR